MRFIQERLASQIYAGVISKQSDLVVNVKLLTERINEVIFYYTNKILPNFINLW